MEKKYKQELEFQKKWAKIFPQNKDKVLNYWKKYRAFDKIVKICQITPVSNILDVGCGISTVLHFLDGYKVGYDPLIKEYRKFYKYPTDIYLNDSSILNSGSFDVVFCSNVLDHVEIPEQYITNIHQALEDNGYFVLTVNVFKQKQIRDDAHPHTFTRNDIWNLIKKKFHIIYMEENPWYGLKNYTQNKLDKSYGNELVLILQKM